MEWIVGVLIVAAPLVAWLSYQRGIESGRSSERRSWQNMLATLGLARWVARSNGRCFWEWNRDILDYAKTKDVS